MLDYTVVRVPVTQIDGRWLFFAEQKKFCRSVAKVLFGISQPRLTSNLEIIGIKSSSFSSLDFKFRCQLKSPTKLNVAHVKISVCQ